MQENVNKCLILKDVERRKSSKEFWKLFSLKKTNTCTDESVNLKSFYEHFKNLASSVGSTHNVDVEEFMSTFSMNSTYEFPRMRLEKR